jgi:hypothetical protein
MMPERPRFSAVTRGDQWFVEAKWPDGTIEIAAGPFNAEADNVKRAAALGLMSAAQVSGRNSYTLAAALLHAPSILRYYFQY